MFLNTSKLLNDLVNRFYMNDFRNSENKFNKYIQWVDLRLIYSSSMN